MYRRHLVVNKGKMKKIGPLFRKTCALCVYIYTYLYTRILIEMYIHIYAYIYTCIYMHIYIHVYIHIYMYIYIKISTGVHSADMLMMHRCIHTELVTSIGVTTCQPSGTGPTVPTDQRNKDSNASWPTWMPQEVSNWLVNGL